MHSYGDYNFKPLEEFYALLIDLTGMRCLLGIYQARNTPT